MTILSDRSFWFWAMLLIVGVILVVVVPEIQARWLYKDWQMHPKERFSTTNEARKIVAQIVGGLAILAGLYFTNKSISTGNTQLELNSNQLKLAQAGQLNDQFVQAVKQLGDDKMVVRLGGIRALGEIANASREYHWIVMDVLAGFVRDKAPWTTKLSMEASHMHFTTWPDELKSPTDIQAAVEVIGLRNRATDREGYVPDLSYTNLRGADFSGFQLEGIELSGAHFEWTDLTGAHLANADLDECHFEYTTMDGTDLTDASLDGAVVKDADLSKVKGLVQKQIDSMIGNRGTVLPQGCHPGSKWD